MQEAFSHTVKEDESFWTMEDGVLHIQCEKVKPGESCRSNYHTVCSRTGLSADGCQHSIFDAAELASVTCRRRAHFLFQGLLRSLVTKKQT